VRAIGRHLLLGIALMTLGHPLDAFGEDPVPKSTRTKRKKQPPAPAPEPEADGGGKLIIVIHHPPPAPRPVPVTEREPVIEVRPTPPEPTLPRRPVQALTETSPPRAEELIPEPTSAPVSPQRVATGPVPIARPLPTPAPRAIEPAATTPTEIPDPGESRDAELSHGLDAATPEVKATHKVPDEAPPESGSGLPDLVAAPPPPQHWVHPIGSFIHAGVGGGNTGATGRLGISVPVRFGLWTVGGYYGLGISGSAWTIGWFDTELTAQVTRELPVPVGRIVFTLGIGPGWAASRGRSCDTPLCGYVPGSPIAITGAFQAGAGWRMTMDTGWEVGFNIANQTLANGVFDFTLNAVFGVGSLAELAAMVSG
jgi:hypothetical protein